MSVTSAQPGSDGKASCCLFYGWAIAVTCTFSKLVKCQGQNNIMSFTVPHLLKELRLSDGELGILFSVATILSSTVQPLFGRTVDKYGARVCVPTAHVAVSVTLFAFSATRFTPVKIFVYVQVVVIFFFIRALSLGALEIFNSACVQRWFVRRRGRALSLMSTFQWLGISGVSLVVGKAVSRYSWQAAACAGALLNLFMALVTALALRSSPEDCGLWPDGDGRVSEQIPVPADASPGADKKIVNSATLPRVVPQEELPSGLWQFYLFSFFFSVIYSSCDFYMLEIVAENPGAKERINVSDHIFVPLAFVCGILSPVLGEAMDRCGSRALAYFLPGVAGMLTFIATNILCYANTPSAAVTYALLRGVTFAVHFAVVASGLVFAAMGVTPHCMGSVLGKNSFAGIAGTGFGPLCFGLAKDTWESFDPALQLSSVPMLLMGLALTFRAGRSRMAAGRSSNSEAPDYAVVRSVGILGKAAHTQEISPDDLVPESPSESLMEAREQPIGRQTSEGASLSIRKASEDSNEMKNSRKASKQES